MSAMVRTRAQDLALAIRHFLAGAEEIARLRAYEVAREAMARGVGLLEMVADHQDGLAILLADAWQPEQATGAARASAELLAESLGPFEMVHRGFQEANETLLRLNTDLEREVAERKQAEAAARLAGEEAVRANGAKSAFVSRMSHEFRGPLTAVLGFGQLLEIDQLSEEQRESVDQILKAGRHLLDLITEAVDIGGIESGRITVTREPAQVEDAISDAVGLTRPIAADRGVTLRVEVPTDTGYILADRRRLREVLLNLLSNAVKYNRPHGRVTVGCRSQPAGWTRIEVSDDGPGIAPQDVKRLFTPFERLGAEGSEVQGTGLGLALSMDLARAMGGDLGVTSAPGLGSTFWLALPVADQPAERDQSVAIEPGTSQAISGQATVLHIENDPSIVRLIQRMLAARPAYRLMTATRGGLGLDMAREHHPDLILLDFNLPDMSGKEVLGRLQSDPQTRVISVVVLSGDAMLDGRGLLESGASGYLTKPFDARRLVELMDRLLNERALPHEGAELPGG